MFDAVLFHATQPKSIFDTIPKTRSYHQKYIFATVEPPIKYIENLSKKNNFYNWTMTYR